SVLLLSLLANLVLGFLLFKANIQLNQQQQVSQINIKILSFTGAFIEKVLLSQKDVDFETRLMLETLVRNLNNKEILDQWQRFTNAPDSQSASLEAEKLLSVLVKQIRY